MSNPQCPRPFSDILAAFPNLGELARGLDVQYPTVAAWKRRDSIPENRWRAIADVARRLGVKGVTYARLSDASAAKGRADVAPGPVTRRTTPAV